MHWLGSCLCPIVVLAADLLQGSHQRLNVLGRRTFHVGRDAQSPTPCRDNDIVLLVQVLTDLHQLLRCEVPFGGRVNAHQMVGSSSWRRLLALIVIVIIAPVHNNIFVKITNHPTMVPTPFHKGHHEQSQLFLLQWQRARFTLLYDLFQRRCQHGQQNRMRLATGIEFAGRGHKFLRIIARLRIHGVFSSEQRGTVDVSRSFVLIQGLPLVMNQRMNVTATDPRRTAEPFVRAARYECGMGEKIAAQGENPHSLGGVDDQINLRLLLLLFLSNGLRHSFQVNGATIRPVQWWQGYHGDIGVGVELLQNGIRPTTRTAVSVLRIGHHANGPLVRMEVADFLPRIHDRGVLILQEENLVALSSLWLLLLF
mmetsp:Transcript_5627/g.11629  ORF Transcript_5627/g.11629 Transcript_5627/m.11629 type:complete len:368 (-) Transcript_5627:1885-2988(-)